MRLPRFHEVKNDYPLHDYIESLGLNVKKKGKEYACCCPFHDDKSPSLQIYYKKGKWSFNCNPCQINGDIFDFTKRYFGIESNLEATKMITGCSEGEYTPPPKREAPPEVDIYADFTPLEIPVNESLSVGKSFNVFNPKSNKAWSCTPLAVHRYPKGYVIRLLIDGNKWTPTVRWCQKGDLCGWVLYPFDDNNRDIYGELKPFGQVIIVEGEKAVDVGSSIFKDTDTSVIGWSGGTNAVRKTDWSVLKGRKVIGIPDNDQPGHDAMYELSHYVDDMRFVIPVGEEKGWDIADREWTRLELINWMTDNFGELSVSEQKIERMKG